MPWDWMSFREGMHREIVRRLRVELAKGRKEDQEWRKIMKERSGPIGGKRTSGRMSCNGRRSKFARRILSVLEVLSVPALI